MNQPTVEVRALTPERLPDFLRLNRWTEAAHDLGAFAHDLTESERSRSDLHELIDCCLCARIDGRRARRDVGGRDVDLLGEARASLGVRAHLQRRRNETAIAVA